MVQEFNVVRCFSCGTFQVEQVKKTSNKWTCKVCNEKQSLKQIFFSGSGKECRVNCQTLNMRRHDKEAEVNQLVQDTSAEVLFAALNENTCNPTFVEVSSGNTQPNKWTHFLEDEQEAEEDTEKEGNDSLSVRFRGEQTNSNARKRRTQTPKRNRCVKATKVSTSENDKCTGSQVYQANVSRISNRPSERLPLKENGNEPFRCQNRNDTTAENVRTPTFENRPRNNGQSCSTGTMGSYNSKNLTAHSKWTKFLSVEKEEEEEFPDEGIV